MATTMATTGPAIAVSNDISAIAIIRLATAKSGYIAGQNWPERLVLAVGHKEAIYVNF